MGACTAAFRLIDALLLRPLPVADASSLYSLGYEFINEREQQDISTSLDYPSFRLLRAAVKDQAADIGTAFHLGEGIAELAQHRTRDEVERTAAQGEFCDRSAERQRTGRPLGHQAGSRSRDP